MLVGVGPSVASYSPVSIIGDRLSILGRVCRSYPDVEDSVIRSQEAQARAVRTYSGADFIRVAKEGIPGYQAAILFCNTSKGQDDEKYDENAYSSYDLTSRNME